LFLSTIFLKQLTRAPFRNIYSVNLIKMKEIEYGGLEVKSY